MSRILLTTPTIYYIDLYNGSDANDGSSGAPWKTLQHSWDWCQHNLDLGGQQLTFQIAPSVYNSNTVTGLIAVERMVGQVAYPIFNGDISNPWNVVVHTNGHCFNAYQDAVFGVSNLTVAADGPGAVAIRSQWNSKIFLKNNFFYITNFAHMEATKDGWIFSDGPYQIWGSALYHAVGDLGTVFISGGDAATVTIFSQPTFTAFAYAVEPTGKVLSHTTTFSGPVVGPRFKGVLGGSIGVGGNVNYFPGSTAGSVDSPGVFY